MAKIVESLERLSVENGMRSHKGNRKIEGKGELILAMEEAISLDQNYILSVCGTQNEPEFKIAAALSDNSCVIYSVGESLCRITTLDHSKKPIVGIKFSPTSGNILYIANLNAEITAYDLRVKNEIVAEFKDVTEVGKTKPLISFDVNSDERIIAGGTEHTNGDAFILFWDVRCTPKTKDNLLGGYWESHMDDITCLAFHSDKPDILTSGSTDGLMNVFDLQQSSEDEALKFSLNTESSVDRLGWLSDDSLWCTTHTHALQLWNYNDAEPYASFDRHHLAMSPSDDPDNCYVVRVHTANTLGKPFLLAGSSTAERETLRCLSMTNNHLQVCNEIIGNKQIVRDSWMHEKSGYLVTAGERGIINVWRQTESTPIQQNSSHKLSTKIDVNKGRDRHHRAKPY